MHKPKIFGNELKNLEHGIRRLAVHCP